MWQLFQNAAHSTLGIVQNLLIAHYALLGILHDITVCFSTIRMHINILDAR